MVFLKKRKWKSKKYRLFISEKPCLRCQEQYNVDGYMDPHHEDYLINNGGMGIKPPDTQALPLCFDCHRISRAMSGPKEFWGNIDYKKAMINYITEYLIENNIK